MLISGDNDPVGEYGKGVKQVFEDLKKTGHQNVIMKLYPEARHELLNELNRDEVMSDIVGWMDKILAKQEGPNNHSSILFLYYLPKISKFSEP